MALRFDILLGVRSSPTLSQILAVGVLGPALGGVAVAWSLPQQSGASGNPAAKIVQTTATSNASSKHAVPLALQQSSASSTLSAAHSGLNIVVLDPAHGGTDPGARGTEGITESDEVLQFATATKRALEAQGFQVILTREGNDNPSRVRITDRKSTRLNSSHTVISYAVFCL